MGSPCLSLWFSCNFLQTFLKQQLRQLKALQFMSFNKMKITFCIIVETFYDNEGDATEPAGLAEKKYKNTFTSILTFTFL